MQHNGAISISYPKPERHAPARGRSCGIALFLWGCLRLPLVALVLYLFRGAVLAGIERVFDITGITEYVIALASTPLTRGAILLSVTVVLSGLWVMIARSFDALTAYVSLVVAVCVALITAFGVAGTRRLYALPAIVILVANLVPDQIVSQLRRIERLQSWFMAIGVGIAELLSLQRYIRWLSSLIGGGAMSRRARSGVLTVLPGLALTSAAVALALDSGPLVPFEQMIRMSPGVSVIDTGDFNWIELDESGRYLYAAGHGLQHLRRYDLTDLSAPPLKSSGAATGGAQGFARDAEAGEIYVYNSETRNLLCFDLTTLELKRSFPLSDVSPGDPWVVVDRHSDTIVVVSEADIEIGTPFTVLSRSTGAVLDRRRFDAGNVLVHPHHPTIYLSFFRHRTGLIAYDLEHRVVLQEVKTDSRVDRMVYWGEAQEVLLALPTESEVARFDANTLERKGSLDSIFGVRTLVVDSARESLLCGSLATGILAVFDLETGQERARYYLGPWLRTIVVDADGGIAYVSANGALYRLNYSDID